MNTNVPASVWFSFVATVALFLGTPGAYSSQDVQNLVSNMWCDPDIVQYDPTHPLAYETLSEATHLLVSDGEWREVDRRIAERFSAYIEANAVSTPEVEEFTRGLLVYLAEDIQKPVWWEPITAEGSQLKYDLPMGEERPREIVAVECADIDTETPQGKGAAAIAYTAVSLYRAGTSELHLSTSVAAAKLSDVYMSHRNRLFNGLPMWLWEHWANGLDIDFDTASPAPAPRDQWIFLRPSISPGLRFNSVEDSEVDAAFILEPAGYVRYTNDDYSQWIGVSPIIAVTTNNGTGYGALVRYGDWQIGAAYHEKSEDMIVYLSLDLNDFVVGKEKRRAEANGFLRKLAARLARK